MPDCLKRHTLPAGASDITEQDGVWIAYKLAQAPAGTLDFRIRFRAAGAFFLNGNLDQGLRRPGPPNPDRSAEAYIDIDNAVVIAEGKHRAVAAAGYGDVEAADGGLAPGYLEYEWDGEIGPAPTNKCRVVDVRMNNLPPV